MHSGTNWWRIGYCAQRQVVSSNRRQATRVSATSPVSSSSSLFRQHLPQPSQSASHSSRRHLRSGFLSQNRGRGPCAGSDRVMGVARISRARAQSASIWRDQRVEAVECLLAAQVFDQGDREVRAVEIALEVEQVGFEVGAVRCRTSAARRSRPRRGSCPCAARPSRRPAPRRRRISADAARRWTCSRWDSPGRGRAARRRSRCPRSGASGRACAAASRGRPSLRAARIEVELTCPVSFPTSSADSHAEAHLRAEALEVPRRSGAALAEAEIRADDDVTQAQPFADHPRAKASGVSAARAALKFSS